MSVDLLSSSKKRKTPGEKARELKHLKGKKKKKVKKTKKKKINKKRKKNKKKKKKTQKTKKKKKQKNKKKKKKTKKKKHKNTKIEGTRTCLIHKRGAQHPGKCQKCPAPKARDRRSSEKGTPHRGGRKGSWPHIQA